MASNSKTNGLNLPEIELIRDFMTVFVTCKFDKDPIKNEGAILVTTFSPLYVYWKNILSLKGA